MGGIGSGNRWRYGTKGICEQYKRIDIRFLRKRGYLKGGYYGNLSWSCGDEPSGNICFKYHGRSLELIYKHREGEGEWESVNEHVPIVRTDQHFGGERLWFSCLSCQRRCSVLYGGAYFRCRRCYGLTYTSQNEDVFDRSLSRARKIRRSLNGSEGIDDPWPAKPKGMHWRTYNAKIEDLARLEEAANMKLIYWMNVLQGNL